MFSSCGPGTWSLKVLDTETHEQLLFYLG